MPGPGGGRDRAAGHRFRTAQPGRLPGRADGSIGGQRDVGVQQRDQGRQVAAARRGQERGGHLPLPAQGGGAALAGRAAHPAPGPAGELTRRLGRASEHRRHIGERHREHVMQHEREPLGRGEHIQHDQQGPADRVSEHRLVRRIAGGATGAGPAWPAAGPVRAACSAASGQESPTGTSCRCRRDRRMLSDTRAATVVSQPPRFCSWLLSVPASRSQVSWTASSASVIEPSSR